LFYTISHWNAVFAPSLRWPFRQFERLNLATVGFSLVGCLLLYSLLRSKNRRYFRADIPFAIVTTGFAGMVLHLMLVFAFQSAYGYVFSWIGLLVASFMAGAACGAMLSTMAMSRIENSRRLFMGIEAAIVCFALGCTIVFLAVSEFLGSPGAFSLRMLFLVASFICGLLVGSQFPLANKMFLGNSPDLSKTAGMLYASDLLGGWFGGIIGAVVLLPVLGLPGACITVGLLKLTSLIVLATRPNRHL
jgi:spermidine synthase